MQAPLAQMTHPARPRQRRSCTWGNAEIKGKLGHLFCNVLFLKGFIQTERGKNLVHQSRDSELSATADTHRLTTSACNCWCWSSTTTAVSAPDTRQNRRSWPWWQAQGYELISAASCRLRSSCPIERLVSSRAVAKLDHSPQQVRVPSPHYILMCQELKRILVRQLQPMELLHAVQVKPA